MTVEAHVSDDFMIGGVAVYIGLRHDRTVSKVMRLEGGVPRWDDHDPLTATGPTLKLDGESARALLDALARHYEGASGMRTARSDLLHERDRVDKLTDAIIGIAAGDAGRPV